MLQLEENLLPSPSKDATILSLKLFEKCSKEVNFHHCLCCRQIRLKFKVNKKGRCADCSRHQDQNHYANLKQLPIWYNDGVPQYHVPPELAALTLAEKVLIQLASPFIPLRHIKNGVMGIHGHVCCFEQDLEHFINTLPRHPTDTTVLHVMREMHCEVGGSTPPSSTKEYLVRRKVVADALFWLKKYNIEYKHIRIDLTALEWLKGEEGFLEVQTLESTASSDKGGDDVMVDDRNEDLGPNPTLTKLNTRCGDNVQAFGYINESPGMVLTSEDTLIHNAVVETVNQSEKKRSIHVQWPANGSIPINEYSSTRIFVRAFPWLFPGGLGDVKEAGEDIQKWGERLLFYEDGRFATDKFFSFFALNYITRRRNAKSSSWFIKDFNKNGPQNLEELKDQIRKGDIRFINRLMYYNRCVKGSTSYWNSKRSQVYAWINHHVEIGNGPPNLFITLSCGEYYWPDILRLVTERMVFAKDDRVNYCCRGSTRLTEILNDYTVVIQEYFQVRFELWMETVGKPIFGIASYWGKYEFAPGRGMIHIHLLAIRKEQNIFRLCYEDLQHPDGKAKRDERLASWANSQFGLTATVVNDFASRTISPDNSPCSIWFSDLQTSPDVVYDDQQNLIKFCQVHDCNGFCLRHKSGKR
jgi:Helitron helicase-like domain at N-terminus